MIHHTTAVPRGEHPGMVHQLVCAPHLQEPVPVRTEGCPLDQPQRGAGGGAPHELSEVYRCLWGRFRREAEELGCSYGQGKGGFVCMFGGGRWNGVGPG